MNKKLLIIVLIAVLVIAVLIFILLQLPKGNTTGGKVELNYWGLWDDPDVYEELLKEYEASHSNVKVVYARKRYGNTGDYSYKGQYQISADERLKSGEADIVRVHQSWVFRLQKDLAPAPQNIFNERQVRQDFYPAVADAITTTRGEVYAAPLIIDGLVLFYNKDMFATAGIQAPPTNWNEAITIAQKLTKTSGGDITQAGLNLGAASNSAHAFEIVLMMMTQANVKVVTNDGTAIKASFATTEGVAAVNSYLDYARKHKVWSARMPNDLEAFSSGKLAMMIAPSWRANDIISYNSKLNFDVASVPTLPGANTNVPQYLASYWVDVVSKNSTNSAEAWKLLGWLSEPEQLRKIHAAELKKRAFGSPYPRVAMKNELADKPYSKVIVQMAPNMKSWPLLDYGTWEESFDQELSQLETRGVQISVFDLQKIQDLLNNSVMK